MPKYSKKSPEKVAKKYLQIKNLKAPEMPDYEIGDLIKIRLYGLFENISDIATAGVVYPYPNSYGPVWQIPEPVWVKNPLDTWNKNIIGQVYETGGTTYKIPPSVTNLPEQEVKELGDGDKAGKFDKDTRTVGVSVKNKSSWALDEVMDSKDSTFRPIDVDPHATVQYIDYDINEYDGLGMTTWHPDISIDGDDGETKTIPSTQTVKPIKTIKTANTVKITNSTSYQTNGSFQMSLDIEDYKEAIGFKTLNDAINAIFHKIEIEPTKKENKDSVNVEKQNRKYVSGIIVDKFIMPVVKSESGEEVSLGNTSAGNLSNGPMYKVLFGDNNILWIRGKDIAPNEDIETTAGK